MKQHQKLLGGVMLLSAVLRVLFINTRSIQYDDAFTYLLASRSPAEIIAGTAADTMPPLFYFILHFWLFLGRELWFVRFLTVLISLGCVYLAYRLVWELTDNPKAGLWTAFLVGISPLQIYHAQDIRMYALLAFSELAYALFFSRIWRNGEGLRDHWGDWLGLVASGAVAMYTHNLAVFWIAVPLAFLFFKRDWRSLGKVLLAVGLIGLISLPWLIKIPGQVEKIQTAFWTPRPGLVEIFQSILMFTATLPLPQPWLMVCAVLSVQILALVGFEVLKGIKGEDALLFLVSFAVLPPALMFVISYLIRPVFVTRGFLAASFAYYGLAGWVISKGWKRHVGKIVAVGFVAAVILSLPYQLSFAEFPRSPFREAVEELEKVSNAESLVLHDNKLSYFPCYFFAPDLRQAFLPDQPGSINDTLAAGTQAALGIFPEEGIAEAVEGINRVYFVTFETTLQNYEILDDSTYPTLDWLNSHYQLVNEQAYNDLLVFTFEHP